MKNTEDIIWRYLDDQAGPEERLQVAQLLETDAAFREQFLQSQVLHRQLRDLEAEGPSMRFSQNVMERLPAVSDLAVGPLISRRWLKLFFAGMATIIVLMSGSGWLLFPESGGVDQQAESLADRINALFGVLPGGALVLGGIVFLSLALLAALDRWLQSRLHRS